MLFDCCCGIGIRDPSYIYADNFRNISCISSQMFPFSFQDSHHVSNLGKHLPSRIHDFSFLSSTAFFLVRTKKSGSILIYTFSSTTPPKLATTLLLPEIQPEHDVCGLYINSTPFHEHPSGDLPFESNPECSIRLITVTYSPGTRGCHYSLFVHTRTLLEYAKRSRAKVLHWENWGPLKTRFIPIKSMNKR